MPEIALETDEDKSIKFKTYNAVIPELRASPIPSEIFFILEQKIPIRYSYEFLGLLIFLNYNFRNLKFRLPYIFQNQANLSKNDIDNKARIYHYLFQVEELYEIELASVFTNYKAQFKGYSNKASRSVAPLFIITKRTYELFFDVKISDAPNSYDGKISKHFSKNLKTLTQKHLDYFIRKVTREKVKKIKGLQKFSENPDSISSLTKGSEELTEYLSKIKSFTSLLESNAPIVMILFGVIFSIPDKKTLNAGRINKVNFEIKSRELYRLLNFTLEYVRGLQELCKNIWQHSSTKIGIVTISAQRWKVEKTLTTFVHDMGETGIIPQFLHDSKRLKETLEDEAEEDLNQNTNGEENLKLIELLDKDINRLQDFTIEKFIAPANITQVLHQQIKREIAHLGLLTFKKTVLQNGGRIRARSQNSIAGGDFYDSQNPSFLPGDVDFTNSGTSFLFESVISRQSQALTTDITNIEQPQASVESIDGFMKLMNYKVVSKPEKANFQTITVFKPTITQAFELYDKITLQKEFEEYKDICSDFLAIDCNDLDMSASDWLRFTAYLSAVEVKPAIILYNIEVSVFFKLMEQNKIWYDIFNLSDNGKSMKPISALDIPFWHNNKQLLVYSFLKYNEKQFYFADSLCGKTQEEFESFNKVISNSYPNLTSIADANKKTESQNKFINSPYLWNETLLPFDSLLVNDGKSLALKNLEFMLTKEMK